jgi:hypothetical protein
LLLFCKIFHGDLCRKTLPFFPNAANAYDPVPLLTSMLYLVRSDTATVSLQERLPEDIAWRSSPILLRLSRQEIVACSTMAAEPPYDPEPPPTRYNVPWMKSCLQKAVRRRKVGVALRMANTMLAQDPAELLRRLPVIVVEDAFLHPLYPALVWLMIAQSKGYAMSKRDAELVLSVVWQVAGVPRRDVVHKGDDAGPCSLSPDDHILCNSLALRANYGGTQGDVQMIRCSADAWRERFRDESWVEVPDAVYSDVPTLDEDVARVGYITPDDRLPEGADFHCFPSVVWKVRKLSGATLSDLEIKRAIWYHRSAVSEKRLVVDPKNRLSLAWSGFRDEGFEEGRDAYGDAWRSICTVVERASAEVTRYTEEPDRKKQASKKRVKRANCSISRFLVNKRQRNDRTDL